MSFKHDYRLQFDAFDEAWRMFFERKEHEEILAREEQRQRERDRQRQQEIQQERDRQLEIQRERERQLEIQRERERQQELARIRHEQERQQQLELQQEQKRQQELQRERERERQQELARIRHETERQQQLELQQERERLQELKRELQRQQELARIQQEQERQQQLELQQERERQQEIQRERERQQELARIRHEQERQQQLELQQERERLQELQREREREQERQQQMMKEQREQLRAKQELQMTEILRTRQLEQEQVKSSSGQKQKQDQKTQKEEERQRDMLRHMQLSRLRLDEEEKEKKRKKYPVVVVGCGASGIAALAKLMEAGIDAVGVEATNRMGGRIHTVNFGAGVVDLGAAWCHGEGENIVYKLASPHGLLGKPEHTGNYQDWYVFSDGTIMPPGNSKAIIKTINNKVNSTVNSKESRGSIREFIRTGIRNQSIIPKPKLIPINEPFIRWYEQDYHLGGREDPLAAKSLKALTRQKICEGEFWQHWNGKGCKTLLDLLLHKIPGTGTPLNPNIQYNKVVTNICYPNPAPDPEDPKPTLLIKFKDGTSMKASKVIVTVPLGVLKKNYGTMFTPTLPPNKIAAINNLQVFVLDKIVMEFKRAWWPKGMVNLRILWRKEDEELFKDEKWVTGIYGFRTVEHHPKTLIAWISGPHAEEMESVREDQLSRGILKLIKHVFSLNFDVPMITKLTRSKWAKNEFAKGSFSYRGVTTERCQFASAEVLSEPVAIAGIPVVFFAGEATSHNWHGHIHGAVQAGFREADAVIKSMAVQE